MRTTTHWARVCCQRSLHASSIVNNKMYKTIIIQTHVMRKNVCDNNVQRLKMNLLILLVLNVGVVCKSTMTLCIFFKKYFVIFKQIFRTEIIFINMLYAICVSWDTKANISTNVFTIESIKCTFISFKFYEKTIFLLAHHALKLINCVIQNITEGDDLIITLWHMKDVCIYKLGILPMAVLKTVWSQFSYHLMSCVSSAMLRLHIAISIKQCLRLKWKFNISILY